MEENKFHNQSDHVLKNRKQNRLSNYDYSQQGMYFVTICTKNREYLFGEIVDGKMELNDVGIIAQKYWLEIPNHFPHVFLDEYVVMPNHIHGIIEISDVGVDNYRPLPENKWSRSLSSVIRGFKIGVTKWSLENYWKYFAWQRNYYDRIIRDEMELNRIREYIFKNPTNWEYDRNNSENILI